MPVTGDVLIVDDNLVNVRVLAEVLQSAGHGVRVATNGARALQTIAVQQPELVLLDVEMPEMDGYEVCRRLKQDPRTAALPVIFLSAHDTPVELRRAFAAGAVDCIAKPFEPALLLARLATHLELSQLRRELAERAPPSGACPTCGRG